MAEIGLIGTIIGIAGAGVKLSITLYTFSETIATASSEIKNIARDVSLTSSVLEELGSNLKQDGQAKLYSGSAVQTAKDVMTECEAVFKEIDGIVAKATESVSKKWPKKGGKLALSALDRLKWPFLQPKMALLQGNLERLKSTLVLMLNVLTYARDLRAEKKESPREGDVYQRTLLENLLRANQEATRNYETLLKAIGPQSEAVNTEQTRSLDLENTQASGPASGPFSALIKSPASAAELEWTIGGCLRRIERALLQFEGSAFRAHSNPRMAVQIELERELGESRYVLGKPNPWVVLSIVRKGQEDTPPAQADSWIPSDVEMYGSLATGAVESLTVDEDRSRSRSQSRDSRHRQSAANYRTAALQAEINDTVGLMRENIDRVSQRGERLESLTDKTDSLSSKSGLFRKPMRRKTWYSSVWESIPSPTAAMSSIQETVKNSGLFFGVENEAENPDAVLEYKDSGAGSPHSPNPVAAKLARSPTFDDILRSPSSEGQFTPLSPTGSKEEGHSAEKPAEPENRVPKSTAGVQAVQAEQKISDLLATEDGFKDASIPTTVEEENSSVIKLPGSEPKQSDETGEDEPPTEPEKSQETVPERSSEKLAAEEQPDEIDELLKEWTTLYEKQ